jgi:2'-5' RNA ligase
MRLFVALLPPQQARSELEAAVAPLRPGWPGLRWAGPDRWHVTLAFLGDVSDTRLDGLRERLGRAASRQQEVQLRIGRGGAFPSAANARVLYAHIAGDAPALAGLRVLAASVAAGARRAGAPPPDEGRRYRPHVTLARSRQPADLSPLTGALSGFSGSDWTARRIGLIRSQPGPEPRYDSIGDWPLRAPANTVTGSDQTSWSRTSATPGTSRTDLEGGPT